MLKKIKQFITVSALGFALAFPLASVAVVSAQDIQGSLQQGACLDTPTTPGTVNADCVAESGGSGSTVNNLVADIINIFSWVVGIVSVIMIIIGGFQYITSAGDSSKVGTAKNTILYAIIGLVIVALAQIIVQFVLGRVIE